jgi:hypothetical protein
VSHTSGFTVGPSVLFEIDLMDRSIRRDRRFAAFLLAALTCLCPALVRAAAPPTNKLQGLVNATAAQIQLAYRQYPEERAQRQEQLVAAVAAWRAAPRSEANNERLSAWLREAILNSMPGSKEPLPAVPNFAAVVKVEPKVEPQPEANEAPAEPTVVEKAIEQKAPTEATEVVAKPQDDPFRDDPVDGDK